jgi:polar amino acid transport system substrate-binding protein
MPGRRITLVLAVAFFASLSFATVLPAQEPPKDILAPGGKLRVGVYPGSPTSMVRQPSGETHGVAFDLGKELAKRLGAAFEPVTHSRVAEIVEAIKAGKIDFTVTNATPARAQDVDFSQTLLSLELGYLLPAGSKIVAIEEIDKAGRRIGVSQGSTSERTLPKILTLASIVSAPNLKEAAQMLNSGQLDAFATNKSILFEMADGLPGATVLKGRWGTEHMAIAIPKGRDAARDYIRKFVEEMRQSGKLSEAAKQSGLRGYVPPE